MDENDAAAISQWIKEVVLGPEDGGVEGLGIFQSGRTSRWGLPLDQQHPLATANQASDWRRDISAATVSR